MRIFDQTARNNEAYNEMNKAEKYIKDNILLLGAKSEWFRMECEKIWRKMPENTNTKNLLFKVGFEGFDLKTRMSYLQT